MQGVNQWSTTIKNESPVARLGPRTRPRSCAWTRLPPLLPSRSRRRYMPHAPPIVGRYGKRPPSRMRRLQLRTVHDLISSPRAFAGRAAPKERLVDSADVPAWALAILATFAER